ncbi:hypothetical protein KP509_11G018600 [Ceratopteris richardii]|uniref:Uncharacterized protein n=1 Tax=Ceratopteris richardii TaxID=49495 RepID=A0A8T2TMG8_CERRI|nr:hypothetical protein KP509_11G018600 [Ceratopteris richardii]
MDYGIGRVDASTNGMAYLFGYSIEKNVWMVAYVPEPGDRHLEIDDFVVWKDGASHRIFLANCSRPCSRELVCPLAAHSHVGTPPSKCTGLDIWELKCYQASDHVSSHANPHVRHYWHHLSRSPSKMWRSFHGSPDEYFNCCDVMFTTSGSTVCVSAGDYLYNYPDDDKYPATVGRRHVCRLVYDVLLDTWSELPPTPIPSSPTERCLGAVPLFAFQPCFHDTF